MDKTKVVFRVWPSENHEVLALFPELPSDVEGLFCSSYMHVGQHGGADYEGCIAKTRPARPEEYADLAEELKRIGYDLEIVSRCTSAMRAKRLAEARR